jgi:DNA-binding response OmpR family regulator
MRLLLVEDDPLIGDGVRAGLSQEGHAVDWFTDGHSAQQALRTEPYELMILDLGLPKKSGLAILEELRATGSDLPVLILTARDTVADRVTGLDAGADDYLIKPFELDELSARLRALHRRSKERSHPVIRYGSIVLDPGSHHVTHEGKVIDLSAREFAVLKLLLENPGRVFSRARLEEHLYSWDEEIESNAVEVYIHHLRKKLGSSVIRTIRGVGYVMDKVT